MQMVAGREPAENERETLRPEIDVRLLRVRATLMPRALRWCMLLVLLLDIHIRGAPPGQMIPIEETRISAPTAEAAR